MAIHNGSRVAGLVALLGLCLGAHAAEADRVVRDLCGKDVAMLGESPTHGFGNTLEFKVGLVRRLVDECHFNAFFIESGAYDFLNIQRRLKSGQEVTEPMVAAAIGGLWANREVQPLIPFLLEKAKAGRVVLGGLDDQFGRGSWAQREMPADLTRRWRARRSRDAWRFCSGICCGSTGVIRHTVPRIRRSSWDAWIGWIAVSMPGQWLTT